MSEVLAAIAEDERGSSLLDRGLAQTADRILGNDAAALREIGPYRIVRVVGEGGMGVVFLAERTDLGSQAAIKILRDAWLSPARRQRFAAEQRTLASLNHPSIARLYDAGALSNGTPWIVMEYVEGTPLTEYCRTHASTIPERLRLFRDVCDAVQYAHRHLVIHRDIKPSNILVTAEGSVKLVDFGISKQLDERGVGADVTQTGARMMTPAYAAPEQIRGDAIGVHTDVYSLGVVLFELLNGRLPGDCLRVALDSPIASLGRSARSELDVLCLTAMHQDLARRYQSVEALSRDIAHYQKGEPLEARPDTVGYRAGKFVRRHWRAVSAAAAAMLTLIVGLVAFYTVRLTNARNAALTEAARAQRIQGSDAQPVYRWRGGRRPRRGSPRRLADRSRRAGSGEPQRRTRGSGLDVPDARGHLSEAGESQRKRSRCSRRRSIDVERSSAPIIPRWPRAWWRWDCCVSAKRSWTRPSGSCARGSR